MTGKLTPVRALGFVLVVTAALYLSLLPAPFLNWDDDSNIFANPFYLAGIWRVFWTSDYFGLWVPVTSTAWQTLFVLGGGAAWPFRLLNAVLHLTNAVLAWRFAARVARALGRPAGWGAVAGAAVFALHPLQVQAVAWISGGRDLLATSFSLVALDLYFRESRRARAGAALAFAAALLSKPSVAVLPAVLLALVPTLGRSRPWRRHALELAPWALGSLLVIARTRAAQAEHLAEVEWWLRPRLVGDAFWFYETRLLEVFRLAPNYARTPAAVLGDPWSLARAVLGFSLLAAAAGPRRTRSLVVAWALFLLPVSGIVAFGYQRISGVADHYAYPAMAMVAAGLAVTLPRAGRLGAAATAGTLVAFAVVTAARLDVWRSNGAFFRDMARAAPEAYSTALGLSIVACTEDQDWFGGVRWTEVALRERPHDVRALANQAYCLNHAGAFERTVRLDADLAELDRARLSRTQPTGLASLLASVGAAKIERGDFAPGYRLLCEAERLFPGAPIYAGNLAAAREILARHGVPPNCD